MKLLYAKVMNHFEQSCKSENQWFENEVIYPQHQIFLITKYKEELDIAQQTVSNWCQDDFEVSLLYPLVALPDLESKLV